MNGVSDDVVDELPQSVRSVAWYLEQNDGSVTRQELITESWLQERSIDRAVTRLEDLGIVRRDRAMDDLRYVRISLVEES